MTSNNDNTGSEIQIRRQIDRFLNAFRNKDLDIMMSLYSPTMISFDIVPPLQDIGANTYRKVWQETFALFEGPIYIDIRDLKIIGDLELAFSHKLVHLKATRKTGQKVDYWERLTFCFQNFEDNWLIIHEHVSVPIDFETGRAVLNLER